MRTTSAFDALQKKREKIQARYANACTERVAVDNELDAERRNIEIDCEGCGAVIRVGDIELLCEDRGSYDQYGEEYRADVRQSFVCPKCTEHFWAPQSKNLFPYGIRYAVKSVIEWHQRERTPERAKTLLAPSIKRAEDLRKKQERERQLEAARRLLAEEEKQTSGQSGTV